jgi:hypothetical protein
LMDPSDGSSWTLRCSGRACAFNSPNLLFS